MLEMGAEPVIMRRTLPPSKARTCVWQCGSVRPRGGQQPPPPTAAYLFKHELVPQLVCGMAMGEVVLLGGKGIVKEELLDTSSDGDALDEFVIDAVEEAGHAGEDGGLENSQVLCGCRGG